MLARSRNVLEITLFTLKKHEAAKSDAWKYFSLFFGKQGADSGSLTEVKYLCVCNACKRVYAYKASDGSGFCDTKFATDYNNGITYVMNALSVRVGSGRVQKRVTRGQLWFYIHSYFQRGGNVWMSDKFAYHAVAYVTRVLGVQGQKQ